MSKRTRSNGNGVGQQLAVKLDNINVKKEGPVSGDEESTPKKRSKSVLPIKKVEQAVVKAELGNGAKVTGKVVKTMAAKAKNGKKVAKVTKPKASAINWKSQPSILPANWFNDSKSKMFVGAHVSISGGLENAVYEAAAIGGQAIALFLCNQRTWNIKPIEEDAIANFKQAIGKFGFKSHLIVPHASYLVNLGSADKDLRAKSLVAFTDGLDRCDKLGIDLYNFHPGSTCGKIPIEECLDNIADGINAAHAKTSKAIAVIENMCKQGNTVGGDFKDIKGIIDRVKDKSRIGVCIDTCHAFAAGYDLSKQSGFDKMMSDFDSIIGFEYLKAVHLNDSKGECASHLDRHENIGKGMIGIKGFERIMSEPRFKNLPMVLETPETSDNYRGEIAQLYKMT
jgi:AP endonuclease-1